VTGWWAAVKKWAGWLVGGLAVLLGAGWLWRRRERELGQLKDKAQAAEAKRAIAHLQGRREELARELGEQDEAVQALEEALRKNRRRLVEAHEGGEELSDDEVERAFARLGF
jgi:hypothetical protein